MLNKNGNNIFFSLAIVIGTILGFFYVDKPDGKEDSVYIVDNRGVSKNDTIVFHDTIYKVKTIVKWKYRKDCCCCIRHTCSMGNIAQQDSITQ